MKKAIIVLCCLLFSSGVRAQLAGEPRAFSGSLIDSLRQVEAYQYGKAPEEFSPGSTPQENLPINEKQNTISVVQWILYLLVAAVLFIVAFIVIRQFSGTTGKQLDRGSGIPVDTEEDLVHSNFQILALAAESENNLRLAFRYQYLWVLQQLQHKNEIVWHPYKTDSDYLAEVKTIELKKALLPIVRAYSFSWYGQKEISASQYQRLMSNVRSFS